MPSRIVTLLTDFGLADPYVGIMKGVILSRAPEAVIVDLTHEVPPQQIMLGALALRSAVEFFPPGTIHVAVVDPGVGSQRHALAVATRRHVFLGPDNGLLGLAAAPNERQEIRRLDNARLFCQPVSATFHGRDIFAAVAGHLAAGTALAEVGPRSDTMVELEFPAPQRRDGELVGTIVYIDRFGNLVTNFDVPSLAAFDKGRVCFRLKNSWVYGIVPTYASLPVGGVGALFGSWGLLEIAVRNGSAATVLEARIGDEVVATQEKRR